MSDRPPTRPRRARAQHADHAPLHPAPRPRAVHALTLLAALAGCEAPATEVARSAVQRSTAEGAGVTASIAAGANHACVLRSSGDVLCWGDNTLRQTAPDATAPLTPIWSLFSATPIQLAGETLDAAELAAGGAITCARRARGDVVCWGNNASGTVSGTPGTASGPVASSITINGTARLARTIAVGTDHLCAVLDDGTVACRGDQATNRLGGIPSSAGSWLLVPSVEDATRVVAGSSHTCALKANGTVLCWGTYAGTAVGFFPTQVDSNVVDIAAGDNHTCVLHSDHSIACWGSNAFGQFGAGPGAPSTSSAPVAAIPVSGEYPTRITAGGTHTCAVYTDNTTRCWGSNGSGRAGLPFATASTNAVSAAVQYAPGADSPNTMSLEAGGNFTCVTVRNDGSADDGAVRCWGDNAFGQLGNNAPGTSSSYIAVQSFTPDVSCGGLYSMWSSPHGGALLDSGNKHTCVFLESNACASAVYSRGVHCWGDNTHGQVGNGTTSATPVATLSKVAGLVGNIVSLSSGGDHSCVVDVLGRVLCWGRNDHGQSGGSTPSPVLTPTQVIMEAATTTRAIAVTTGDGFSCALMATSEVQCWGDNTFGQLGRVAPWFSVGVSSSTPPSPAAVLPAGWNGAFNPTGARVRCGSCGSTPFLSLATQISAGSNAACARLSNGEIRCWGHNPRATLPSPATLRTGATENTRLFGCGGDGRFCGCGGGATNFCVTGTVPFNNQFALDVLPHAGRPNANFLSHLSGAYYLPPTCGETAGGTGLGYIVSVAVHDRGGCVVWSRGSAQCWGAADNGRRGDGATTGTTQLLTTVTGGAAAAAQLMTTGGANTPLSSVVAVNGGAATTCALRSDGRVACWGANALRQAGVGPTAPAPDQSRAAPVFISEPNSSLHAISVTAGTEQSCAMTQGWLRCWGARTGGMISASHKAIPVLAF